MTIKLIGVNKQYLGLSTDTKPTAADVVAGALCYETDTGLTWLYDGSAWTVQSSASLEVTVLASAARTAATQSADLPNPGARGVIVVIDVTVSAATPSLTFTIQGKSSLGADYYTILAAAAITGVGVTVLRVYPGLTAIGNLTASDVLPKVWRVDVAVGDADSVTYSVNAIYIP